MENRKNIKFLIKAGRKKSILFFIFYFLFSNKGSLLIEILVAISVLAIILSLGAQSSFVSLVASKNAVNSDVALGLATETLEAVRSASDEKWQNLYTLTKSTQYYYPSQSGGKWVISNTGNEIVTINSIPYSRYFIVENVSRDPSTHAIETSYNSLHDDPSTQKVTATASSTSIVPVSISAYLSRWRNKVCPQTSWVGGVGSGVKNCPDTTYVSATNLGTPGASLQIQ